jgi:hypothetical protein
VSARTDDLTTWLRAQLDEDERTFATTDSTTLGLTTDAMRSYVERGPAEVEAKRRILGEHPHEPAAPWGTAEVTSIGCATCHDYGQGIIGKGWCRTVQLLAQPYAGQDGWREEWAATQR